MEPQRTPGLARGARGVLDSLTILAFLAVIVAPRLDLWVRPDSARSPEERELRPAAPKPPPPRTAVEALAWPSKYEQYYKDSFGLRDVLLRWNSIVKVFVFGVSPTPDVYFGREGWCFYSGQRTIDSHRGALPFRPAQLADWAHQLEAKRRLLESLGVAYLYVVAPDKESVYPELLPGYMRPIGPSRLDQWLDYLRVHAPKVPILDLRPTLVAAKRSDAPDDWVYTKLGTHWSGRGSFVALRAVLGRMEELVGGFAPEDLDRFYRKEFAGSGDSWATRMYLDDLLPQRIHGYVPPQKLSKTRFVSEFRFGRVLKREITDSTRPRVILMHDSFGPHIEEGLAEQCSYIECRWDFAVDAGEIAAAAPAILVDMFVERALNTLDPEKLAPIEEDPWPRRFARSNRTLVVADRDHPTWGIRALGEAQLGPKFELPRPRLPIQVDKPSDIVEFGPLVPVAGEVPVAHLSIDSPFPTELTLWYLAEGQKDVARREGYRVRLSRGPNELYLPLDREGTSGRLFLRPGTRGGIYLLRELEIRSVTLP